MSQITYNDLIDAAKNTNAIQDDTDKLVESRYAAVIASAKRARQLIDGAEPVLMNAEGRKPLAIAVEELARNLVTIKRGTEVDDDPKIAARENQSFAFALDEDGESEDTDGESEEESMELETSVASSEDNYNSDSEA